MKSQHQRRIEKFMAKAKQPVPDRPTIPSREVRLLRARLILEEACETIEALGFKVTKATIEPSAKKVDLLQIADGCGDLSVVTIGTLSACGIQDEPVLRAIDVNNLRKFGKGATLDQYGKLIKPKQHKPPDLRAVLRLLGWDRAT
jgi:predicted HAD superfamily Cof-like phosphohydrolase